MLNVDLPVQPINRQRFLNKEHLKKDFLNRELNGEPTNKEPIDKELIKRITNNEQSNQLSYPNSQANGHMNGHLNGHMNGHLNGHLNGHPNSQANGHLNGHPNSQANSHPNGHPNSIQNSSHYQENNLQTKSSPPSVRQRTSVEKVKSDLIKHSNLNKNSNPDSNREARKDSINSSINSSLECCPALPPRFECYSARQSNYIKSANVKQTNVKQLVNASKPNDLQSTKCSSKSSSNLKSDAKPIHPHKTSNSVSNLMAMFGKHSSGNESKSAKKQGI